MTRRSPWKECGAGPTRPGHPAGSNSRRPTTSGISVGCRWMVTVPAPRDPPAGQYPPARHRRGCWLLVGGLGLRTVIDLRDRREAAREGHGLLQSTVVEWINLPVRRARPMAADAVPEVCGADLAGFCPAMLDGLGAALLEAARTVGDAERHTVLFHCTAGKDRPAWRAAADAVGVSADDIVLDCALTGARPGRTCEGPADAVVVLRRAARPGTRLHGRGPRSDVPLTERTAHRFGRGCVMAPSRGPGRCGTAAPAGGTGRTGHGRTSLKAPAARSADNRRRDRLELRHLGTPGVKISALCPGAVSFDTSDVCSPGEVRGDRRQGSPRPTG